MARSNHVSDSAPQRRTGRTLLDPSNILFVILSLRVKQRPWIVGDFFFVLSLEDFLGEASRSATSTDSKERQTNERSIS